MTKTTKENRKNFEEVITAFENAVMNGTDGKAYAVALQALATACTYSVLKKCINVSNDKVLVALRQNLTKDLKSLEDITYMSTHAYKVKYNEDGERVVEVVDKTLAKAFDKLASDTLSDGMDLLQTAVVAILDEVAKAKSRGVLASGFFTAPYTKRVLDKRVVIKDADSAKWVEKETAPIKEVFRAVRSQIMETRSIRVNPSNGYSYLADVVTDEQTGIDETIYRRFNKYADLGGYVKDFNGACGVYTIDEQTATDTQEIIAKLNLTAKQMRILDYRMRGYGIKAIGSCLGVSHQAVAKTLTKIQERAKAIGLTPCNTDTNSTDGNK